MRLRYEQRHSPECFAMEAVTSGVWATPWWLPSMYRGDGGEWRAVDGTMRGRTTHWLRFECNATNCDAAVLVREVDLLASVPPHDWQAADHEVLNP